MVTAGVMAMGRTVQEWAKHWAVCSFVGGRSHHYFGWDLGTAMDGRVWTRDGVIGYMYIVRCMHA